MKEAYQDLDMEVIVFDAEDVIRTSGGDENEGPQYPADD